METKRHKFFEDNKGNQSSTRLMAFLAFIVACAISFIVLFAKVQDNAPGFWLILLFLSYSVGSKAFKDAMDLMERKK